MIAISVDGVSVQPTDRQAMWIAGGAGAVVVGLARGSGLTMLLGVAAVIGGAAAVWEDGRILRAPDTMNAHFVTGGEASAVTDDPGRVRAVLAGIGRRRR